MNETNIICSRKSKDFIILYDGLGTYYLYYQKDLILDIAEPINPKQLFKNNNLLETLPNIKKNAKTTTIIIILINEITNIIGDEPKNQHIIKQVLYDLVSSLKDAETDAQYNMKHLSNAPGVVIEKARELTQIAGNKTTIFDDLITPIDIDAEIKQREKPILNNEEKAKADAIADEINKIGLLPYLDNILKDIHMGEHKNIYRKILMLFKIMRGEASFLSETTAKAEAGKSFEDEIVFNLIAPQRYIFKLNDFTPASFKRYGAINPYYFDRKIVLFGDLGSKKAFNQVEDVFNIFKVLITENEYHSSKADKNDDLKNIELDLKVNSIGAVYSTITNSFTENDNQLESRTLFSTPAIVNPSDIARQIFYLQIPKTKQSKARAKAEQNLKEFGLYLMQMVNSDIEIINPYFDVFWDYANKSENPIREFNQQLELFNAYCILTQNKCKDEPLNTKFASIDQLKEYMDFINLENALIPYEYDFLNMIMAKGKANELKILYTDNDLQDAEGNSKDIDLDAITTLTECENNALELINNEYIETFADLSPNELKTIPFKLNAIYGLRSAGANHKDKIFFRYSDLKGIYYRYNAFKNVDNVPGLLQSLHNKGYLGKYEYKQGKENLYYLTPLCETLTSTFAPKKSYNQYVSDYFLNAGYENF